jgi:hypothetical protein
MANGSDSEDSEEEMIERKRRISPAAASKKKPKTAEDEDGDTPVRKTKERVVRKPKEDPELSSDIEAEEAHEDVAPVSQKRSQSFSSDNEGELTPKRSLDEVEFESSPELGPSKKR